MSNGGYTQRFGHSRAWASHIPLDFYEEWLWPLTPPIILMPIACIP